ncbi:MAG: hypothetical protein WCK51_04320 [Armatimonadota bacterium]
MRLRFPTKTEIYRFSGLGLCAWTGPLVYIFAPFSHSGNILGNIWWCFGILEGTFAWFFRSEFTGTPFFQSVKSYVTLIAAGVSLAGVVALSQAFGLTIFEPMLWDGGCEPISLDTPLAMLQFQVINAVVAIPTLVLLVSAARRSRQNQPGATFEVDTR